MQRTDVCIGPGLLICHPYMPERRAANALRPDGFAFRCRGVSTPQLPLRPLFGILGDALRRYDTGLTSAPA
jgi:hypothetical protein